MASHQQLARRLLNIAGITYAAGAGIRLDNKPMPLFQLLVLCMLASKPIDATIAMRAARELYAAGLRTPKAVLDSRRQTMIGAFGRAGYARYDESSATRLTSMAERVRDEYSGDLRAINKLSQHDLGAATNMLKGFTGIGDTGAGIFLREVQDVWTWVRPYFDQRAVAEAEALGLPTEANRLGALAPRTNARLAAALVRSALDNGIHRQVAG